MEKQTHQYELWFQGKTVNNKIFEMATNDHFRAYRELIYRAVKCSTSGVFEIVQKTREQIVNKRRIILENVQSQEK